VEGELGVVGNADGRGGAATRASEAARFVAATGVDALAVSVGNAHCQTDRRADIDFKALREIEVVTHLPLVLHGVSGIPLETRTRLARESNVCKLNLGTELRMCFGEALRKAVERDPNRFDRIALLKETEAPVRALAQRFLRSISPPNGRVTAKTAEPPG
jgi:fructose-bisphosphate aldolase class II